VDKAMFKKRTRNVALRVIKLVNALPNSRAADVIGRQLLRSATSIGANYRAACRSRSAADMVSRLSITEEEADEALYWLELLAQSNTVASPRLEPLRKGDRRDCGDDRHFNQNAPFPVNPKSKIQKLK
jgi:four helix bundle protein